MLIRLHLAAGRDIIVSYLLEHGAQVNLKNKYGRSALHSTAAYGHKTTAAILMEAKADINTQDEKGRTPLHDAALNGHSEMVEGLLGGNMHHKTSRGWTASAEVLFLPSPFLHLHTCTTVNFEPCFVCFRPCQGVITPLQ